MPHTGSILFRFYADSRVFSLADGADQILQHLPELFEHFSFLFGRVAGP